MSAVSITAATAAPVGFSFAPDEEILVRDPGDAE
jgi:hypothetical protein